MANNKEIKWLAKPEEHDYPAAYSYLNLLFPDNEAKSLVEKLKKAPVLKFKAKDIFRASGLAILGKDNYHVKKNMKKINDGDVLSPLLLVRHCGLCKVIIADGYHRMCTAYIIDEDVWIPLQITSNK